MSTAAAPVSLDEYLNTDYEPDCDYVDGFLEERNVGKNKHSRTQTLLTIWLGAREAEQGFKAMTEQRVQVAPRRIRIPDICLLERNDNDEVTQRPPLLWIEILSPEDRWKRIQTRLNDALSFGVRTIWIIDPYEREAWIATPEHGTVPVEDGRLRCTDPGLEVALDEILPEN
jgi:Uma2 family endonuclease